MGQRHLASPQRRTGCCAPTRLNVAGLIFPVFDPDRSQGPTGARPYLDKALRRRVVGVRPALLHRATGTFGFGAAAPSQVTLRSTAHTARTIA